MPESKPAPISIRPSDDWKEVLGDLGRQLDYIISDIYNYFDSLLGYGGKGSVVVHTHQASDQGGDYPWADFIAADVTYLQALRAAIASVTNIWDKSTSVPVPLLGAAPDAPASGALFYVIDNAGTKECRIKFANTADKLIANDA